MTHPSHLNTHPNKCITVEDHGVYLDSGGWLMTTLPELRLEQFRESLATVEARIAKLEAKRPDDGLADHFHLGTVGGSGRNIARLNRKRERDMEKSIDLAGELAPLYRKRQWIKAAIADNESGGGRHAGRPSRKPGPSGSATRRWATWFSTARLGRPRWCA